MTVTTGPTGPRDGSELILALLAVAFSAATVVWAAAFTSTFVWTGTAAHVSLGDSLAAIPALAETPGRPGDAFGRSRFAPAAVFWTVLVVWVGVVAVVVWQLFVRLGTNIGTADRDRLGVSTDSRMATHRDLKPLIVPGPVPDRLILGRVDGKLVATEHRAATTARHARTGDRSSVAVIGPTRCGKTANTITGILEWTGPAVLSSVKSDLLNATIDRRHELGDVRVFDPAGLTGYDTCGWSPLRGVDSAVDAMKRTQHLLDALSVDNTSNMDFFKAMAEQLLWPMLFAAAVSDATIDDVVRWVNTQDRPNLQPPTDLAGDRRVTATSEVATLLQRQTRSADPRRRADAHRALDTINGIWTADERTRGNTYSTAPTLVRAWADPAIAAAGAIDPAIDLHWLLSGTNTLYVIAPEHDFSRLAVVYGALFGDLFTQAYEHTTRTGQALDPSLLFVLDEAAQTPVDWLPSVASTCAGIGILLVTIWQSIAQMHAAFGRHADTVLTNHGSKLFFSGISDPATLDYVHKLVGDALLLHGTLPPAHLRSRPWYDQRQP